MSLSHLQNMKLLIFDFDGTIADTSEGIIDSHRFALRSMNAEMKTDEKLRSLIGGNLLKTYTDNFGFSEDDARVAVKIYRERYGQIGIHKAVIYPGFADLLRCLKENGYQIAVATLKAERFVRIMLEEMHIRPYFDAICGMNHDDSLDKAGLIMKCIKLCDCKCQNTVMIGDSENDWIGANAANVSFIGVTYGFGFSADGSYDFLTAGSTKEIGSLLVRQTACR